MPMQPHRFVIPSRHLFLCADAHSQTIAALLYWWAVVGWLVPTMLLLPAARLPPARPRLHRRRQPCCSLGAASAQLRQLAARLEAGICSFLHGCRTLHPHICTDTGGRQPPPASLRARFPLAFAPYQYLARMLRRCAALRLTARLECPRSCIQPIFPYPVQTLNFPVRFVLAGGRQEHASTLGVLCPLAAHAIAAVCSSCQQRAADT